MKYEIVGTTWCKGKFTSGKDAGKEWTGCRLAAAPIREDGSKPFLNVYKVARDVADFIADLESGTVVSLYFGEDKKVIGYEVEPAE